MKGSTKNDSMKKNQALTVAVALALTTAAAFAQVKQAAPDGAKQRIQLDTNQDGVIDRAEAAKQPTLAERFDQLDKNRDGQLSADERPQMGGKHRRHGNQGGKSRMKALDTDNDGRISRAEMQSGQRMAAERFDRMDVNKDGYVDRADAQARATQQRAEFFKGADTNRDGRVTRDEFIVEQGARSADRRDKQAARAQASGKPMRVRQTPTNQQQIERAGTAFDVRDANKDGALTRAELDAFQGEHRGMRHGKGAGNGAGNAEVHAPKS